MTKYFYATWDSRMICPSRREPDDATQNITVELDGEPSQTIREMASKYGLSLRTLRFYEERGFLLPRRYGSERRYGPEDELRLQLVLVGRRLGFTLRDIKLIVERSAKGRSKSTVTLHSLLDRSEIESRLKSLEERRVSLDAAIAELRGRLKG